MSTKVLLNGTLMFPSDYVAAVEFKGKDVTLTIAGVRLEDLAMRGGKKERKPVITFKETRKKLVLNKTNAGTIGDIYGSAAEAWVGKRVTLYPTRTQCGRETVDCIRVREKVNGQAHAPPLEPEPEPQDQGFDDLPDSPFANTEDAAPPDSPAATNDAQQQTEPGAGGKEVVHINGLDVVTTLPDAARGNEKWIDELIVALRPEGMPGMTAKKKFHQQHAPDSWAALALLKHQPERQDELYAQALKLAAEGKWFD